MDKNRHILSGILLQLNVTQATHYMVKLVLSMLEKTDGFLECQLAS